MNKNTNTHKPLVGGSNPPATTIFFSLTVYDVFLQEKTNYL
jgi:hypothetical protein